MTNGTRGTTAFALVSVKVSLNIRIVRIALFVVNTPHPTSCKLGYHNNIIVYNLKLNVSIMLRVFTWPWPKAISGKQATLYQSDIRSLYPQQGLSDGVIDFYARFTHTLYIFELISKHIYFFRAMLPSSTSVQVLSCNTYDAIKRHDSDSDTKALLESHRAVNGNCSLDKPIILFPCNAKFVNHYQN